MGQYVNVMHGLQLQENGIDGIMNTRKQWNTVENSARSTYQDTKRW